MVKIPKTLSDLDILAQIFREEVYLKLPIKTQIEAAIQAANDSGNGAEEVLYSTLKSDLNAIITGRPDILEGLINRLKPLYDAVVQSRIDRLLPPVDKEHIAEIKKGFKSELLAVFNYSRFINFDDGDWAYGHAKRMDLAVCPYCNMQYTFTVKSTRGKSRPQFDHFISKSKHPYFAISFYNLVPSCYVCNANFKGNKKFLPSTHIHPFVEGMEDCLVFKTNVKKAEYLMGKTGFELNLDIPKGGNKSKKSKADKNSNVFHFSEIYKFHKEYAGELILKAFAYTDTKMDEMLNDYPSKSIGGQPIFKSKEEILKMLFGSQIKEDMVHKRSLAKLTRDILSELGIKL